MRGESIQVQCTAGEYSVQRAYEDSVHVEYSVQRAYEYSDQCADMGRYSQSVGK